MLHYYFCQLHSPHPLFLCDSLQPFDMLRTHLSRSAARLSKRATCGAAARRKFSATPLRPAEVELTIDGKKVSIEGMS